MSKSIPLISVLVLVITLYYSFTQQISRFLVERNFNNFPHGTLCLEFPNEGNIIKKYGKKSSDTSECSVKINVNNSEDFFYYLLFRGERGVGLGEAYVDGIWYLDDNQDLGQVIYFLAHNVLSMPRSWFKYVILYSSTHFLKNKYNRFLDGFHDIFFDKKAISHHYDLGNDIYESFLDETMMYSCAVWSRNTNTLKEAQLNKLNILYNKLDIPNENDTNEITNILDIGSGWGYFPNYISERNKNTNITGITISDNQLNLSISKFSENCKRENCPIFINRDYRLLHEYENFFDRIVSIGMLEHVGISQLNEFMKHATRITKPKTSRMVLHYITQNNIYPESHYLNRFSPCNDISFVGKYIFPGGCILFPNSITEYAKKHGWTEIHREQFGIHYARTLAEWRINFNKNWNKVSKNNKKYDIRLLRTYNYYFANAESSFRTGYVSLVQHVFTNNDITYQSKPYKVSANNPNNYL